MDEQFDRLMSQSAGGEGERGEGGKVGHANQPESFYLIPFKLLSSGLTLLLNRSWWVGRVRDIYVYLCGQSTPKNPFHHLR